MHTLTETWLLRRSTTSMRTRRRGIMRKKVIEIEQGTFTPLVFTTTGGMADECVKYHSRLAELIANKKGESYSSAISWIRAKVSFAIVRSAILCLRSSRSRRRQLDFVDSEFNWLWTACKSYWPHLSRKECIWEIVIDTVIAIFMIYNNS